MRKFILSFILFAFSFFYFVPLAQAALVTVNKDSQVIWQVLGSETGNLTVKNIATLPNPPPNAQISLNNEDGKIKLHVTSDGTKTETDVTNFKDDIIKVDQRGDTNELKIKSQDNKFTIEEKSIVAQTSFPIIIDPTKNELLVDTGSGSRLIAILPYEATQSLMRANVITKSISPLTLSESATGELQYEITGEKNVNILNVASITVPITSLVSATSGDIINVNEPIWLKILGFVWQ